MGTLLHLVREVPVLIEREQMLTDGTPIVGPDQKSVLAVNDHLADASDVRDDDGVLEVHGFQERIRYPLVA
jgi:hypothetical protein